MKAALAKCEDIWWNSVYLHCIHLMMMMMIVMLLSSSSLLLLLFSHVFSSNCCNYFISVVTLLYVGYSYDGGHKRE